jgi:hypothetical protein
VSTPGPVAIAGHQSAMGHTRSNGHTNSEWFGCAAGTTPTGESHQSAVLRCAARSHTASNGRRDPTAFAVKPNRSHRGRLDTSACDFSAVVESADMVAAPRPAFPMRRPRPFGGPTTPVLRGARAG